MDVYEGTHLGAWKDKGFIHLSFYHHFLTLSFPLEEWEEIKEELKQLIKKAD